MNKKFHFGYQTVTSAIEIDLEKLLKGGLHEWPLFYETTVVSEGLGSLATKVHLEYE